ncbi:MAG: Fis family transcriptional regulator [Fulvimarina sp.]|nr:Fis family transcriptional regulator [Fulvimarina sp.]
MTDGGTERGRLGDSFDSFLKDQGIHEEATATATKRVIAYQLRQLMTEQGISKVEMASRLETSRAQLDRVLDPNNDSVTLATLSRAAQAVGRTIRLELA